MTDLSAKLLSQINELNAACNQSRLALAGMVSVQSALDLLDCRPTDTKAIAQQALCTTEAGEVKVLEAIAAFEAQMEPSGNPYEDFRKLRIAGTKLIYALTEGSSR